jgi:N-acetylglutamate synthase-like GNAT family acetyltransferase
MDTLPVFRLRSATAGDDEAIHLLIRAVQINPMNLDWRHFVLAVDQDGKMIGCGQVKRHNDGSYELASIAVVPEWRGRGVARAIITHLRDAYIKERPGQPLYLTCMGRLGPLYARFGFREVRPEEMTPYFRRISRIAGWIGKLGRMSDRMLVMVHWAAPGSSHIPPGP